jgi:drug/metabolite transporter (DMT)-like permease
MKNQTKAYLFALTAVLFWSTIGSAFKLTLRTVDFLHLVLFSSFVSVVALFIILLLQGKLDLLRHLTGRDLLRSAGLGFLNPFLYYVILLRAYDLLLAQEAVVLNYVWPMTLVLLSIPILRQKIGLMSIVALLISFAGVVIITLQGDLTRLHFTNLTGVLLALGSTIVWALYWIFNVKDRREEVPKLFLNFCFGFCYVLLATTLYKGLTFPGWRGLLGVAYIGLFEMGITYVVWLKALRLSATTAKVSNLIFISPFLSLLFVALVVGERIMGYTLVGLVFIIGGIVLQRFTR